MAMTFEGGFTRNYVTTVTRAVGPTTLTGARGTLPFPSPNPADGNGANPGVIWLAKNGNNANSGLTAAAPKLTIAGAAAALTATRATIHIFRNAFVGNMVFDLNSGAADVVLTTKSIQVEEGEIAYVDSSVSRVLSVTTGKINGLFFTNKAFMITLGAGTIGNCASEMQVYLTKGSILEYSLVPLRIATNDTGNPIYTLNNNIFIPAMQMVFSVSGHLNPISPFIQYSPTVVGAATTTTIAITRCLFLTPTGLTQGPHLLQLGDYGAITTAHTVNINYNSSYIDAVDFTVGYKTAAANPSWTINNTFTNCLNKTNNNINPDNGDFLPFSPFPTNISTNFFFANPIAINTLANYVNYTGSYANWYPNIIVNATSYLKLDVVNLYGTSLQQAGKATLSGGRYFLNSPLSTAGIGGVAVNPWSESTALASQTFTTNIPIIWNPSGYKAGPGKFINPVEWTDIQGGTHSAYDAIRKTWELSFGDGDFYANNQDLWRIVQLMNDTSSQRWYPRGIGNSIFTDPDGAPRAIQGQYNSTSQTFTPFISSGIPMIPKHWAGYWIIITVAGVDKHFYISDNDSIQLTLIDKLAVTLPSTGIYYFRIEYIMVRLAMKDLDVVQQYFTKFLQGGSWGESGTTVVSRANTLAHELKGYSLSLAEVVDPEEAV